MTPSEARDVLIDYQSGGTLIPENEFKMMEALQVAIVALEQPAIPNEQSILASLNKYLDETPREQVLADWDATSHIEGGITVDEYLASLQPTPFQFTDLDDIVDEIDSKLIRYATEESEFWHHWRIGVMDGLKKAQLMMNAPVYHYLPEVPDNEAHVIVYEKDYMEGVESEYVCTGNTVGLFVTADGDYITPYAWTRIPPKPPVKPTEEHP